VPVTYERRSLGKKCTLYSDPAGLPGNYPEILLKYVDIEVGRVVSGRPGMVAFRRAEHGDGVVASIRPDVWAFRRAERGDGVVACGCAGAWAARRASPTAEAVG
jgi:hypothetical protein